MVKDLDAMSFQERLALYISLGLHERKYIPFLTRVMLKEWKAEIHKKHLSKRRR